MENGRRILVTILIFNTCGVPIYFAPKNTTEFAPNKNYNTEKQPPVVNSIWGENEDHDQQLYEQILNHDNNDDELELEDDIVEEDHQQYHQYEQALLYEQILNHDNNADGLVVDIVEEDQSNKKRITDEPVKNGNIITESSEETESKPGKNPSNLENVTKPDLSVEEHVTEETPSKESLTSLDDSSEDKTWDDIFDLMR